MENGDFMESSQKSELTAAIWTAIDKIEKWNRNPRLHLEPAAVARQWERLDPRIDRVIFGDGRALEASERGCLGGSGATARYTPSPERLDPHRAQRQRQIRAAE